MVFRRCLPARANISGKFSLASAFKLWFYWKWRHTGSVWLEVYWAACVSGCVCSSTALRRWDGASERFRTSLKEASSASEFLFKRWFLLLKAAFFCSFCCNICVSLQVRWRADLWRWSRREGGRFVPVWPGQQGAATLISALFTRHEAHARICTKTINRENLNCLHNILSHSSLFQIWWSVSCCV